MVGYIATGEETLWDIAKKYHTTVESIKQRNPVLNERKSDRIKRSDKLLLVKAAK
jgi:LysM repeat protein